MEVPFGTFYQTDTIDDRPLPDNTDFLARNNMWSAGSQVAKGLGDELHRRIDAGQTSFLLGFLGSAHNSGLALIDVCDAEGIRIVTNCEEERFSGVKHHSGYPQGAVREVGLVLKERGIAAEDILGVFYAFDVVLEEQVALRSLLANSKVLRGRQLRGYLGGVQPTVDLNEDERRQARKNMFSHAPAAASAFRRLKADLGLKPEIPCIQMLHHECHAYAAYLESPFARSARPDVKTLVACIDGGGDLSSTSIFVKGAEWDLFQRNQRANSLETFFLLCGMILGGWTLLGPEGYSRSDNRFMSAAAHGNADRLTNPFYKRLRQYFFFADNGGLYVNAELAANSHSGLEAIVGSFDAYAFDPQRDELCFGAGSHTTRARFDVAAAVQLVLEDALFHVIDNAIRETGATQLVLCGQVALNTIANMRLLEHFDKNYFRQNELGDEPLKLWVSPMSADQGAVAGAAMQFAAMNGGQAPRQRSGVYRCGRAARWRDLQHLHPAAPFSGPIDQEEAAELMADLVASNAVVAVCSGAAENGARALGHRSILFNPRCEDARAILNTKVKQREPWRPLSSMVVLDEAKRWFNLESGAAADGFDAYRYMAISARATQEARDHIPAVVGPDGTCRIQIVDDSNEPFLASYLKALGRRIGAAVSINTSLNIRTPIIQTAEQAFEVFEMSKMIDALFLLDEAGEVYFLSKRARGNAMNVKSIELPAPSTLKQHSGRAPMK